MPDYPHAGHVPAARWPHRQQSKTAAGPHVCRRPQVFHYAISAKNLLGLGTAVGGLVAYSYVQNLEKAAAAAVKRPAILLCLLRNRVFLLCRLACLTHRAIFSAGAEDHVTADLAVRLCRLTAAAGILHRGCSCKPTWPGGGRPTQETNMQGAVGRVDRLFGAASARSSPVMVHSGRVDMTLRVVCCRRGCGVALDAHERVG